MRALLLVLLLAACTPPPPATEESAPAPLRLAGTQWVMLTDAPPDGAPTLSFAEGGRASGFTGCNGWFAQVDQRAGGLRFQAIGMTRRACEQAVMDVERDFADRLARTQAIDLDDSTLTLIGENGAVLARFRAAP